MRTRHFTAKIVAIAICVGCWSTAVHAQGTLVKLYGLSSKTPADWKKEKPANRLRSYQFRLAGKKKGDVAAELAILPNLTGDDDNNIARWKAMFKSTGTKGKANASKVYKKKQVIILDVSGTFVNTHGRPGEKVVPKPGFRMFAVILDTKNGKSLIRLIGPQTTLEHHKAKFDKWIDGFVN